MELMKRIKLFALCAVSMFAFALSGCSDDDKKTDSDIYVDDPKSLSQEIFADDTSIQSGVTFVTAGAWTSSISDVTSTRSEAVVVPDWISIDPVSGDKASKYSINIELDPNYTGASRKAKITVYCNDDKIEITINQVATKEDGAKPVKMVKQINVTERSNGGIREPKMVLDFRYNNDDRIAKYAVTEVGSSEREFTFSYPSDSKVAIQVNSFGGDSSWGWHDGQYIFDLNKDRHVTQLLDTKEDDLYHFAYEDSYIKTINYDWNEDDADGENDILAQFNWNMTTGNLRSVWDNYYDNTVNYENYMGEKPNDVMNIDVNALVSLPLAIDYSGFPAEVLQLFDLLGKRSQNYSLNNYFFNPYYNYPEYNDGEYKWDTTRTNELNEYVFDRDGYVLSLEVKAKEVSKKIEISTGNVLETKTNSYSSLCEFVY